MDRPIVGIYGEIRGFLSYSEAFRDRMATEGRADGESQAYGAFRHSQRCAGGAHEFDRKEPY